MKQSVLSSNSSKTPKRLIIIWRRSTDFPIARPEIMLHVHDNESYRSRGRTKSFRLTSITCYDFIVSTTPYVLPCVFLDCRTRSRTTTKTTLFYIRHYTHFMRTSGHPGYSQETIRRQRRTITFIHTFNNKIVIFFLFLSFNFEWRPIYVYKCIYAFRASTGKTLRVQRMGATSSLSVATVRSKKRPRRVSERASRTDTRRSHGAPSRQSRVRPTGTWWWHVRTRVRAQRRCCCKNK